VETILPLQIADAIFIGLSIAFFAVSFGLIYVFEKLRARK
jgi:hypothetical protein